MKIILLIAIFTTLSSSAFAQGPQVLKPAPVQTSSKNYYIQQAINNLNDALTNLTSYGSFNPRNLALNFSNALRNMQMALSAQENVQSYMCKIKTFTATHIGISTDKVTAFNEAYSKCTQKEFTKSKCDIDPVFENLN